MSDCNYDRVVIEGGLNMSELNARVSVNITFVFANNEVFTLAADETARDKVMQLKARIDMWGKPVHIETGTKMDITSPRRKS